MRKITIEIDDEEFLEYYSLSYGVGHLDIKDDDRALYTLLRKIFLACKEKAKPDETSEVVRQFEAYLKAAVQSPLENNLIIGGIQSLSQEVEKILTNE